MRYRRAELTDPRNCAPFIPVGLVVRANSAAVVSEDAPNRWTVLIEQASGVWSSPSMLTLKPAPVCSTTRSEISPSHLQRLSVHCSAPPDPHGVRRSSHRWCSRSPQPQMYAAS